MRIIRAYKTELKPNKTQTALLKQHINGARFVYNWALATRKDAYEQDGKTLNAFALNTELTKMKQDNLWLYEVSNTSLQEAIRNMCRAYDNFFRGCKQGSKVGYPRFKSRNNPVQSFTLRSTIHIDSDRIKLPKLGWVKLKERDYLPMSDDQFTAAHISLVADRWFVSVQAETDIPDHRPQGAAIGIDLGIKYLATCSNGIVFENPKALKSRLRKLARLQRQLSRKKDGSNNRLKAKQKIAKFHCKIADIRKDSTHKATSSIIRDADPAMVGLEDLNVKGMMANHKIAQAISDAAMSEFKRQLIYKADWNGIDVVTVDRWFPSSKTCSRCGSIKDSLELSERTYKCEHCGLVIDRDLNAAINIRNVAVKSTETINACGEESSGSEYRVKLCLDEAGTLASVGEHALV